MHAENTNCRSQITIKLLRLLKDFIERVQQGQPLLASVGFLMLSAVIPTFLLMFLDERTLNGVSVWAKPLKFQISLAVHLLTIALLMQFIPQSKRRDLIFNVLVAVILVTALFEVLYIALQASKGQASHFNLNTPATRLMYSLMAIAAVTLLVASGCIGVSVLRYAQKDDPLAFAAGIGLVLGSILGTLTGLYLGGQPGHWVGGVASDASGIPFFGWSKTGGDLRVAHFIGLHAIQILPLTAWGLSTRFSAERCRTSVYITAILLVVITGMAFTQAKLGLPLIPV